MHVDAYTKCWRNCKNDCKINGCLNKQPSASFCGLYLPCDKHLSQNIEGFHFTGKASWLSLVWVRRKDSAFPYPQSFLAAWRGRSRKENQPAFHYPLCRWTQAGKSCQSSSKSMLRVHTLACHFCSLWITGLNSLQFGLCEQISYWGRWGYPLSLRDVLNIPLVPCHCLPPPYICLAASVQGYLDPIWSFFLPYRLATWITLANARNWADIMTGIYPMGFGYAMVSLGGP